MEPTPSNEPKHEVTPVDEGAVRDYLAAKQAEATAASVQQPTVTPIPTVIDPQIPPLPQQLPTTQPETPLVMNKMKAPWLRLVIFGAIILLVYKFAYSLIVGSLAFNIYKAVYDATSKTLLFLVTYGPYLEILLVGMITLLIGYWFTNTIKGINSVLLALFTIFTGVAIADYTTSLVFNMQYFTQEVLNYAYSVQHTSAWNITTTINVLGYAIYALCGIVSIIAVYFVMRFLLARIRIKVLYVIVVFIIFILPLAVNIVMRSIKNSQIADASSKIIEKNNKIRAEQDAKVQAEKDQSKQDLTLKYTFFGANLSYRTKGWITNFTTPQILIWDTVDFQASSDATAALKGAEITMISLGNPVKDYATFKSSLKNISNLKELNRSDGLKSLSYTKIDESNPKSTLYVTNVFDSNQNNYLFITYIAQTDKVQDPDYQLQLKTIIDSVSFNSYSN